MRGEGIASPNRDRPLAENLALWKEMKEGTERVRVVCCLLFVFVRVTNAAMCACVCAGLAMLRARQDQCELAQQGDARPRHLPLQPHTAPQDRVRQVLLGL